MILTSPEMVASMMRIVDILCAKEINGRLLTEDEYLAKAAALEYLRAFAIYGASTFPKGPDFQEDSDPQES